MSFVRVLLLVVVTVAFAGAVTRCVVETVRSIKAKKESKQSQSDAAEENLQKEVEDENVDIKPSAR